MVGRGAAKREVDGCGSWRLRSMAGGEASGRGEAASVRGEATSARDEADSEGVEGGCSSSCATDRDLDRSRDMAIASEGAALSRSSSRVMWA